MATFVLDTVQDSQIEQFGNQQIRAVRTGFVTGVTSTDNPEDLLFHCLTAAGMPAAGSEHPSYPLSFLTRKQVFGITERGARIKLFYEPFSGVVDTTYIITTGARAQTFETNFYQGTRVPRYIGWSQVNPLTASIQTIPVDLARTTSLRMCSTVNVYLLKAGTITPAQQAAYANSAVGYVNEQTWMGRAKGHWFISEYVVDASRYGGYITVRGTAMTAGPTEDWRDAQVMYNSQTGKYLYSPLVVGFLATAMAKPYEAYTELVADPKTQGCSVYCPFPTTDMPSKFGF